MDDFNTKYSKELDKGNILNALTNENIVKIGNFLSVYKVPWKNELAQNEDENFVAVKKAEEFDQKTLISREIEIHKFLNAHKLTHVPKFYDCFVTGFQNFHIVTEFLPNSLETYSLDEDFPLPDFYKNFLFSNYPKDRIAVYFQLASGIAEIHELGLAHNQINPANLVLTKPYGGLLKIINLGKATALTQEKGGFQTKEAVSYKTQLKLFDLLKLESDDLREIIEDWKDDIWNLGLTIYELENNLDGQAFDFIAHYTKDEDKNKDIARKSVTDRDWLGHYGIDICSEKNKVCFYDVLKQIMKVYKSDRKITANDVSKAFAQILGWIPEQKESDCRKKGLYWNLFDILSGCAEKKEKLFINL